MKKILLVFLVVAVVATGLFFFFKGEKMGAADPAAFIAEDVLFCFTQKDLGATLDDFKKSRLGKTIGQIDFVKMAEDMGLLPEDAARIEKGQKDAIEFLNGPVFKEIFNDDFTFALGPLEMSIPENPVGSLDDHLLLIARPAHGTQFINLLTSGVLKVLNQTNVQYGDHTIKIFQMEKGKILATAAVRDLVVIAFNEKLIRDSLDRFDKKKSSLSENEAFKKLRGMFKDPVSFSYVGMESLRKQMAALLETTDIKQKNLLKNTWSKWSGLQAAGYGVWRETDTIRERGVFVVDSARLDPALKKFYATPAEKNSSLAIVPQNVLAYYWTNTMDFPAYWQMYLNGSGLNREQIDALREGAQRQLGMDIESALSLLDHQCGVIVQDGAGKKLLPVPDFSIFVHLRDSSRINELAQGVLKKNALQTQVQDYKGVKITALSGFFQSGFMPSFAINDQYLIVASSMMMIRQIIDTMKEGHGLADNPRFQKVNAGLLDENNSVGYMRVGEMMQVIKGMVGWGRAIVALRDPGNAKKAAIVIDRLVDPVLDGLAMYTDFGLRSRISSNQILIESTTIVEH